MRKNNQPSKECTLCHVFKLRSEFHFSKKSRGWLKPNCKSCRANANYNPNSNRNTPPEIRRAQYLNRRRAWYQKSFAIEPEKFRLYCQTRRARIRKAEGLFTTEQWLQKFQYYGERCVYCDLELSENTVTKDHKIPLVRGGSNWIANIVPSCLRCNDSKGTKTYNEFVYGTTNKLQ